MMWGNGSYMAWGWPFGLLVVVGIVLLAIWAVRSVGGSVQHHDQRAATSRDEGAVQPSKARQILDERFAAGDLSADQYREQLKVLGIPSSGADGGDGKR
ncbi:SHOCT domain-containing protein [Cryobacterium sp. 5I3]|uniref:SHOCT domain-containing protein n=1 Tax=Cryobacterium sp. 5I3 TaxID=3048592 RepID=UPI002B2303D8|nr:SHOCT domain-containing protein [Cryobacterium sp. 5I3]MEB0200926.1 SHOCT domain-containing protein [Cryobacterium sp. 5I3]